MNLIICGGRDWSPEMAFSMIVDAVGLLLGWPISGKPDLVILSGCCRGADYQGEQFGYQWGLLVRQFDPRKYGRWPWAGPTRNSAMVAEADAVIAFPTPGSRGTWDVVRKALKKGIPVVVA